MGKIALSLGYAGSFRQKDGLIGIVGEITVHQVNGLFKLVAEAIHLAQGMTETFNGGKNGLERGWWFLELGSLGWASKT